MGVEEDGRLAGIDLCPWAKYSPQHHLGYPALFHMLDAGAVAGCLWDTYLTESQRTLIAAGTGLWDRAARSLLMFLAAGHDLGKLSRFQMCEATPWARVSDALRADTGPWQLVAHERASMHAALGIFEDLGYGTGGSASPAVRAAQMLSSHHGYFHQLDTHGAASPERVALDLGGEAWRDLRVRYMALLQRLTGAHEPPLQMSTPAAVLISGLIVVADRLASQPHAWQPRATSPAFGAAEHWEHLHKASMDHPDGWATGTVRDAGMERTVLPRAGFNQAHPQVEEPNPLQRSVMEQLPPTVRDKGPGILLVTDTMGAGKTITGLEAARMFNNHCGTSGILILQPTRATADAAYDTLTAYVRAHQPQHAAVTLAHGQHRLNTAYEADCLTAGYSLRDPAPPAGDTGFGALFLPAPEPESSSGRRHRKIRSVTAPERWLQSHDHSMLAPYTVASIDQALAAVLPVRYSALRMLSLTGRTVIIDEVHAHSPYTLRLTQRLLTWLGAMDTPVVILSATLPTPLADALIRAYLKGAGHPPRAVTARNYSPPYPGWLYACARDATTTTIDPVHQGAQAQKQRRSVTIEHRPITYAERPDPVLPTAPGTRLRNIHQEISQISAQGGTAAVVSATVADSQDAFLHLKHNFPWAKDELLLLHARFPGHQREAKTRFIRGALSRHGPRPHRLVLVTTSLLELSLDADVDVMITDLASMARILQRLGRLWRFQKAWKHNRPHGVADRLPWTQGRGPRLIVLDPTRGGTTDLPPGWTSAESPFLLHATAAHLAGQRHGVLDVTLPDDLPALIESIHVHPLISDSPSLAARYQEHLADLAAREHLASNHMVPPPDRINSLADLHRQAVTAGQAPTREGARHRTLLACYRHHSGRHTLDREGTMPLPFHNRPTPTQAKAILEHTLPVPEAWVRGGKPVPVPPSWTSHPLLARLVLLIAEPSDPRPVPFGDHLLRMDPELGLVHTRS